MSKVTKDKALEIVQGLSDGAEVIIRKPDEEETFLKNYKEAEIERDLKSRVGKLYDDLDNDVYEVTGIRKEPREKTYDYVKRMLNDYKGKASEDAAALKAKIAKLEKEGASGDLAKELETLRNTSTKARSEFEQKIAELNTRLANKDVEIALNDGLREFRFTEGIPKPVLDTYVLTAKKDLIASAKIVEGKVVFLDKDGNTAIDQATYQPKTAAQMLKEKLSEVIDQGHKGEGTGSEPPKRVTEKDGKSHPLIIIPTGVNTRIKLSEHLQKTGLATGSKEFDEAYAHYGKDLPLG